MWRFAGFPTFARGSIVHDHGCTAVVLSVDLRTGSVVSISIHHHSIVFEGNDSAKFHCYRLSPFFTALIKAAASGDVSSIVSADPESYHAAELSLLDHAAALGNWRAVATLLEANRAILPEHTLSLNSALAWAATGGCSRVLRMLLAAGASVLVETTDFGPVLHVAAAAGRQSIIGILLTAGCTATMKNKRGETALHAAAASGTARGITEPLLSACLEEVDVDGMSALHAAAKSGNVNGVLALIAAGAQLEKLNFKHMTALSVAAEDGNLHIVTALLKAGAKINEFHRGDSALSLATEKNHADVVETLIRHGADPNRENGRQWLPLFIAARFNCVATARVLLAGGAHVGGISCYNATALHPAVYWGFTDIVDMLLAAGAPLGVVEMRIGTVVHAAVSGGNAHILEKLIAAGAPLNKAGGMRQHTALQMAMMKSDRLGDDMVQMLKKAHASVKCDTNAHPS